MDPFAELALGLLDNTAHAILAEVRELRMVFMPYADTRKGARVLNLLDLITHYVEVSLHRDQILPVSTPSSNIPYVEVSCQHAITHAELKAMDPKVLGQEVENIMAIKLAEEIVKQSLMDVREISTPNQQPDTSIIRGRVALLKPKP